IRYLFYYNEDIGISPHKHDLESLQIELAVQQPAARKRQPGNPSETPKDCPDQKQGIEIVLVRASGSAHGIGWFTSTLDTETADDILLPLTVLVEEGKHASAPDRNGDGVYTP